MPRFYFDVVDDGVVTRDSDGLELPDLAAAEREAVCSLSDMAADTFPARPHGAVAIQVRGSGATKVITATMTLTVVRSVRRRDDAL